MAATLGGPEDGPVLAAAKRAARPFGAELACVFAPADAADLMPLMGDGFMSGVQTAALDSLTEAAALGEAQARASALAVDYAPASFTALGSPVREGLAMEARFSDLMVLSADAAVGKGLLAEAFQMLLMDERCPVLVARGTTSEALGCAVVAWDGGREATRAARAAAPWLTAFARVLILSAPDATARAFDPERLRAYFEAVGVRAEVETLMGQGDPAIALLDAAKAAGAELLVAGAYGHSRLQEVVFGGTTRTLIQAKDAPALFLAH